MEKIINNEHLSNIKFAADCAIKDPDSIYSQEFFMLLDETFGSKGDYESPTQAVAVAWLINRVNEMDKRAEAAEAKLAERESNPLIDHLEKCSAIVASWPEWKKQGADASKFTRPAPAADLAGMVPDEMTWNQAHSLLDINQCGEDRFSAFMMGANYNRSAILRKIDEMK